MSNTQSSPSGKPTDTPIYRIYGAGTPVDVEACSPEIAEAIYCEQYGVDVSRIATRRIL